ILGRTGANDVEIRAYDGAQRSLFDDARIDALFSERVRCGKAVNSDEFATKAQLDAVCGAEALSFVSETHLGTYDYICLDGQEITMHQIDISDDTSLAVSGPGIILTDDSLSLSDILQDLAPLGAPGSDGQFIVATGAGTFAYESGATARAS